MLALAHHYDEVVASAAGRYRARVYGQPQEDGMWGGWIVFFPLGGGPVIATARETTQANLAELGYWASGLTQLYLHGALDRAFALQPEAQLAAELDKLEQIEASAHARAETLEAAAAAADVEATLAEAARERAEERLLGAVANAAETDAAAHEFAAARSREKAEAAERTLRSRKRKETKE